MGWVDQQLPARARWSETPRLLMAVVVLCVGGCRESDLAVDLAVLPDSLKSSAQTEERHGVPEMTPRAAALVKLSGAINESLSFRFSLRSGAAPIERPDLRVKPFSSPDGELGPSAVQIFRLHGVPILEWPGWHVRALPPNERDPHPLDVLVPIHAPRGGLPGMIPPDTTYQFWVELTIPKGTADGSYTTDIELVAGDEVVGRVGVELVVYPFILPDEGQIPLIVELDHRALFAHHLRYHGRPYCPTVDDWRNDALSAEFDSLLRSTIRLLQSHRLNPVLHRLAPLFKVGASDIVTVNWDQYDAIVEPFLDGRDFFNRIPLRVWPLPIYRILHDPAFGYPAPTEAMSNLLQAYIAQCAQHFTEKGWLDRSFAFLDSASALTPQEVSWVESVAKSVRSIDERIPILLNRFPQDVHPYGWTGYAPPASTAPDIWMPPAQLFDAQAMAAQRAMGRKTWMAVDRPPFSGSVAVSARPQDTRVLARQAELLGAEALFVGCVNRWPDAGLYPTPEDCVRFDPNVLLYPGGPFGLDEPVCSTRLKHLRQSLQDAAYDKLLIEHGLEHISHTLRHSLISYGGSDAYRTHFADGRRIGWPDHPAPFEVARGIMARELIAAVSDGEAESRAEALIRATFWRQFMLATRKLHLNVDGVRVRLIPSTAARSAEVECSLTLENRTRAPVSGSLRFGELPDGWTAAAGEQTFEALSPNASRRLRLTALANAIPTLPGGFLTLPLVVVTEQEPVRRLMARVSCVSALPTVNPVRIDGDLVDWPAGATNVASEFILISGGPADPPESAAGRPRNATHALVMRDADNLYIAVNCEIGPHAVQPDTRRKTVRYDDLIPVGGELIEILIDPYNTGTRSPADLYHIVVKRNGTDLTEKGIRLDPPCGRREPWPVDIEVGTKASDERWTTELRIPLSAFGPTVTEKTVWGFNITRFDWAGQEFSTWSGAVRNAYDPLSLGNLHLP